VRAVRFTTPEVGFAVSRDAFLGVSVHGYRVPLP
jgi:hypothetical protein